MKGRDGKGRQGQARHGSVGTTGINRADIAIHVNGIWRSALYHFGISSLPPAGLPLRWEQLGT